MKPGLMEALEKETSVLWRAGDKPTEYEVLYDFINYYIGIFQTDSTDYLRVSNQEFVRLVKERHPKEPKTVTLKDVIEVLNAEGSHKAAFVESGKILNTMETDQIHTVRDVVVIEGVWYEVTSAITAYDVSDRSYEIYEVKKTTEGFSD
jgi:uncharacterized membrane protein